MSDAVPETAADAGWQPLPARAARLDALQGLLATKPGMPLPADLSHDFSIVIAVTLVLVMACAFQVSRRS